MRDGDESSSLFLANTFVLGRMIRALNAPEESPAQNALSGGQPRRPRSYSAHDSPFAAPINQQAGPASRLSLAHRAQPSWSLAD
ncbi:hypothetical protein PCANC_02010 [Puccinia coronata f. sp. avenae]|uniref:Uncharacterized protein n=1 Tax=Puccinia coronata f. sp. avenae TaxID=200324 RepID=A0A2N5T2R5_9BASI|nr:hypothetical protein PCANC_07667 [Puccinia coronata f. sp. avenae]PLW56233.1 hypothetical protein PCANC_02010 [Puccinia coronata f. sp. avenae]